MKEGISPVSSEFAMTNPEIAELETPLAVVLESLRENILTATYGLLLGDDTSGRIPTLVMQKVMNIVNRKEDHPDIIACFIKGSQEQETIEKRLENRAGKWLGNGDKQKVLVVTEYISSGHTMRAIAHGLKTYGIECDIAAISTFVSNEQLLAKKLQLPWSTELFVGEYNCYEPLLHGRSDLVGLDKFLDVHDRYTIFSQPNERKWMRASRGDVSVLANRLAQTVFKL